MEYGICHLSLIPLKAKPTDESELISQVLFGEAFLILSRYKQWVKIKLALDDHEGWVDQKQILEVDETTFKISENAPIAMDLVQPATANSHYLPILMGSTLPAFDGMNLKIGKLKYVYSGQAVLPNKVVPSGDLVKKLARKYMYAPYLWGGRSPFGIDCSGLTQMVFKLMGITIKRDSYQQAEAGKPLNLVEETRNGDLAFFGKEAGKITHVGIVIEPKPNEEDPTIERQIIHASGQVRIDKIDHLGIYNMKTQQYTHDLKMLTRII